MIVLSPRFEMVGFFVEEPLFLNGSNLFFEVKRRRAIFFEFIKEGRHHRAQLQKCIQMNKQNYNIKLYEAFIIVHSYFYNHSSDIFIIMSTQLLFDSIRNADNQLVKSISQNLMPKMDTIIDSQNMTLLHVAANSSNLQILEYFLKAYQQMQTQHPQNYTNQRKKRWLLRKDSDGFSCLHYAVFRANFKMATLLEQHEADIYQINSQGLNVLHIAAQGNSPLLMYYYLNKGMKISGIDSKGSTPLHWACYSGQESSAYSLISWGAEIDRQETTFGMTPLHLAVLSGNGRIVRKLLIKGCDRNIKSYSGKSALNLAQENEYLSIAEMIIDKQGIEQLMNIKTPFRKLNRFNFPFYFLLFLFLSSYFLNIAFVVSEQIQVQTQLAAIFLSLGIIVLTFFLIAYLSNPGYLKPQKPLNEFQMLLNNKQNSICFDCKILKPERSRHCQICNSCVSVYDHHCPWIANCVGSNNYWIFFCFLISLLIFMLYTIVYSVFNLFETPWTEIQGLEIMRVICEIYSLMIASLFIIPLIFLMIVQTRNCFQNKTTFERFSSNKIFANRLSQTTTQTSVPVSHSKEGDSINDKLLGSGSFSIEMGTHGNTDHTEMQDEFSFGNCYKMWCDNSQNETYKLTGTS